MLPMPLTVEELRNRAVTHSLFAPTTIRSAVEKLGLVQADPIRSPARAQDLILRQRVAGYRVGELEKQYPNLELDEDFIHVYGFLPSSAIELLRPRPREWQLEQEHPGMAEQIVEFIGANGETSHRQLEAQFGSKRTVGNWGSQAKVTTRLLELLHYRGQIRVARRSGNERFYVLAPQPEATFTPDEKLRSLMRLLVNLYAPVPEATLRYLANALRYGAPTLTARREIVAKMVAAGELVQTQVDRILYTWLPDQPAQGDVPRAVRLLTPFDPLVWDRARFEHLWGWPYRFEAYTPPAKRRWGYYALPLLWCQHIIGWANVNIRENQFDIEVGFVDGRPSEPDFDPALEAEIERLKEFLF
jgi:uncharacterized protein YcaQ